MPSAWLRYLQLCDVAGPISADMDEILRQARQARYFPGDGDIDLISLVHALPGDMPLSLEIPTEVLRPQGVSALERAQQALTKTCHLLAAL